MYAKSVIIFASFVLIKSAKILVVMPTPSISHQVVFRPLIEALVDLNHEVTVITPDPAYPKGKSPKNLSEIDVHDLSYMLWQEIFSILENNGESDFVSTLRVAFQVLHNIFHEQLRDSSVLELIRDKTTKFDLLMTEDCVTPAVIFSYIFEAPVIAISSHGARQGSMAMIGAGTHPLLYPSHFRQRIHNLTTWEKIGGLYSNVALDNLFESQESHDDKMLQNVFGAKTPTISQLKQNVHMLFLNVHPSWAYNQPVPPNFVYTWGIYKTPEKELPSELQSYLDSSKHGVIYVSFGTNFKVSSLPRETLDIFVEVFSRLPYNILWKWELDELPGKPDNVKISTWFPQFDVLRHPNVKLFITQGGLQSTDEAIRAGVPLIGLPVFVDQSSNIEKYVYYKIGLKLSLKSLSIEKLENAIKAIFTDYTSYKQNIIRLRTQMLDQSKPALERCVWWVEYVLRHGGAEHLRAPAANMTWVEYFELEVIFLMLTGVTVLGVLLLLTLRYILTYISLVINSIKLT